ncbi:MAG: hypothetical protein M2R45_03641 [Verrucomicrobia subdivision 3 bacterium]|nr:hypothetical protein [Limisphaerales bacterium]MCS1416863.1 hypothetical protein [Limisphaerales bacterium]
MTLMLDAYQVRDGPLLDEFVRLFKAERFHLARLRNFWEDVSDHLEYRKKDH